MGLKLGTIGRACTESLEWTNSTGATVVVEGILVKVEFPGLTENVVEFIDPVFFREEYSAKGENAEDAVAWGNGIF